MTITSPFSGTDNLKTVIHNFFNASRTNILHHTIHPNQSSLTGALRSIWMGAFNKVDSPETVQLKLKNLHPLVLEHYKPSLEKAKSPEELANLARSYFIRSDNQTPRLISTIKNDKTHPEYINVAGKLQGVWNELKGKTFLSVEEALSSVNQTLQDADIPQSLKDLYTKDVSLTSSLVGLERRLNKYLNDLELTEPGVIPTSIGSQGFPKIIKVQKAPPVVGFMKSFRNTLEMDQHVLYSFLFNTCLKKHTPSIEVPGASMFDFQNKTYVDSRGTKSSLPPSYEGLIQEYFLKVSSTNTPRSDFTLEQEKNFETIIQTHPIGFFDQVEGMNLADFFREKYLSLDSVQKEQFFSSLGRISFLDLILGNQDRLINFMPDLQSGKYPSFDEIGEYDVVKSNLGNLMISHDFVKLYPIDNGIGDGKNSSSDPEELKSQINDTHQYSLFLKNALDPNFEHLASIYLIKALQKAIEETHQGRPDYSKESIETLLNDISSYSGAVEDSMKDMRILIESSILPSWNSPKGSILKTKLDPNLVETIDKRLNLLNAHNDIPILMRSTSSGSEIPSPLNSPRSLRRYSAGRATPFSPVQDPIDLAGIANYLESKIPEISSSDIRSEILTIIDSLPFYFDLSSDLTEEISSEIISEESLRSLIEELRLYQNSDT